ncbi:hypothetical protein ACFL0Y_03820 [Patescibacteria group bacterium]
MTIKPLTDPDEVTGQLRQLDIYQRQRMERGPGNSSTADLVQEAEIAARLLEAQNRMVINMAGEIVRRSIEGE